jgi:hypothetical protein
MKFGAPKKNSATFKQKNFGNNCGYISFNIGPQKPASGTSLVLECMTQGQPKKHIMVYREEGTLRTKRV